MFEDQPSVVETTGESTRGFARHHGPDDHAEGSAEVMPAAMCVGGELAAARRARSSAWLPGAGPELHIA